VSDICERHGLSSNFTTFLWRLQEWRTFLFSDAVFRIPFVPLVWAITGRAEHNKGTAHLHEMRVESWIPSDLRLAVGPEIDQKGNKSQSSRVLSASSLFALVSNPPFFVLGREGGSSKGLVSICGKL
jgi:hypothetical protein